MKITDLKMWVTNPEKNARSYVFLRVDTDEGISEIRVELNEEFVAAHLDEDWR